jgi:spore germination cell wall hydrolase CwlJ-like protein
MKLSSIFSGAINVAIVISIATLASAKSHDVQEFVKSFSDDDKYCLQQNVYFEARNESVVGQASVAWVTLNRWKSNKFPNDVCEVVWQRKQFSWTHDGKSDRPKEMEAWERAGRVIKMVLEDYGWEREDPTLGATHYHATYVSPYWTISLSEVKKIGTHVFYK